MMGCPFGIDVLHNAYPLSKTSAIAMTHIHRNIGLSLSLISSHCFAKNENENKKSENTLRLYWRHRRLSFVSPILLVFLFVYHSLVSPSLRLASASSVVKSIQIHIPLLAIHLISFLIWQLVKNQTAPDENAKSVCYTRVCVLCMSASCVRLADFHHHHHHLGNRPSVTLLTFIVFVAVVVIVSFLMFSA